MGMFNIQISPVVRALVLTVHQYSFITSLFHAQFFVSFFYFISKHLEVTVIGFWIKFSFDYNAIRLLICWHKCCFCLSFLLQHWIFYLVLFHLLSFTWHPIENNIILTDLFHMTFFLKYVNFGKLNSRWKIGLIKFERYWHTKPYRFIIYSGLNFVYVILMRISSSVCH